MPEQPKKRPWFQYHLSTAIVVMFVASGLLWLNVRNQNWIHLPDDDLPSYGWPFIYFNRYWMFEGSKSLFYNEWYCWHLIGNILIALAIVIVVAFVCEWHIRRAAKKKGKEF